MNRTSIKSKPRKGSFAQLVNRIFGENSPKAKKERGKKEKPRSELTSFLLQLGIFAPLCALLLPLTVALTSNESELVTGYLSSFLFDLGGLSFALLSLGVWAFLLGLIRWIFRTKVDKHCITRTTVLSVMTGLCASAGIYGGVNAVLSYISQDTYTRHPLEIGGGILLVCVALAGLILCIALYVFARIKKFTGTGLVFDLLTAIMTTFALFFLGGVAENALSAAVHFWGW